ncbi:unnamed protein product [Ophioblennius macclurei]
MLRLVPVLLFLLVLLLLLGRRTAAVHNNATESISPQPDITLQEQGDVRLPLGGEDQANQARNGGRRLPEAAATRNGPDQSHVGCRELRSTKHISDGQCISVDPIKELVCAGECLPNHLLPNWIGGGGYGGRYWSRRDAQEWRCVIDRTRTQRIRLQCHDGSSRTYKITVVTSCKCKRYNRQHNDSGHRDAEANGSRPRKSQDKAAPPEELTQSHD